MLQSVTVLVLAGGVVVFPGRTTPVIVLVQRRVAADIAIRSVGVQVRRWLLERADGPPRLSSALCVSRCELVFVHRRGLLRALLRITRAAFEVVVASPLR